MKTKIKTNKDRKNKNQKAYYRRHSEKLKNKMKDTRKENPKKTR
jgi:hypothetical protein